MHELPLLISVADQVTDVARDNGIDQVSAVVLQIGEVSGIVPEFLQDGAPIIFDDYDILRTSKLVIETIPGIGECNECGEQFHINFHKGLCPVCGSFDKKVIAGREFIIKEIRVLEERKAS